MPAISSPTLLDRVADLRRLREAWRDALGGRSRLVLLAGEAGIGKSRLLRELALEVEREGGRSLIGACMQLGTTPIPFMPLAEILRRLARDDDEASRAALGPARIELATLVPALATNGASDGGAPPADDGRSALSESAARARLFEAVLGLVERLATGSPLLVGVEDVHWSDPATRDLVTFLVRNLVDRRLLVVLTLRTDGLPRSSPVVPWLAELLRVAAAERIDLDRLPLDDVRRQVEAITGRQPDVETMHLIWRRSEGNPYFVEELLASGADRRGDGGAAVPGETLSRTLAEILLARVAGLSPRAVEAVRAVAVAGTPVEDSLLEHALGVSLDELRPALREPIDAGLLRVDDAGLVRSRHALLGEVVEASLLAGDRRRLHEALAGAFEAALPTTGGGAASAATARARHWMAAGRPVEAHRASLDAAAAASAVYAHAEAARHLLDALELGARLPDPPSPPARVELLLRTIDALDLAGDETAAIELAHEALALVDETSDPVRAGTIHSRLGFLRWVVGHGDQAIAEHRRAVELVPSTPATQERAQVVGGLGGALMGAGQYAESRTVCEEAIRVAIAAGATKDESRARNMLGSDLVALGEVDAGLAELREARRLAAVDAPLDVLVIAHHNLALNLLFADRRDEAVVEALAGRDLARRVGVERRYAPFLAGVAADAMYRSGRWDEAAALADETLAVVSGSRSLIHLLAVRARIHAGRGERALAADRLEDGARLAGDGLDHDLAAYVAVARAEAALLAGLDGDAVAAAQEGLRALEATEDATSELPLLAVVARAHAELAASARAERAAGVVLELGAAADAVANRARDLAALAATPSGRSWADRTRAEADRAAGDPSVAGWEAAVASADAAGLVLDAAEARLRLAEALLRSRTDRGRAEATLRSAFDAATRLGAAPLLDDLRSLARLARVDLGPAAEPQAPAGSPARPGAGRATSLSERELEVLRLVAEGRSNGEIAEALFITRKTASTHVTHILDKLGVTSRLEAAMTASRLGLLPPPTTPEGDR